MTNNAFYRQAKFLTSAAKISQLPPDEGYEIVFAGRSNAGKSSVLNVLTQQKNLARTSKTPGRTQLMNVFSLDAERRLIDLPGYGYAKVPIKVKQQWQKAIGEYFQNRTCLRGIMLIMDIRHPLKEFDQEMLQWAQDCKIPIHILLNKADKLANGVAKNVLLQTEKELEPYADLVTIQLFSALKQAGREICYKILNQWLDKK